MLFKKLSRENYCVSCLWAALTAMHHTCAVGVLAFTATPRHQLLQPFTYPSVTDSVLPWLHMTSSAAQSCYSSTVGQQPRRTDLPQ